MTIFRFLHECRRSVWLFAIAASVTGCANVDVQRVTDANRDSVRGIRYWRPAPYLKVSAEGAEACAGSIVYLPDPREEYVITPSAGFGTITFKPSLTDGWNLTALDATVDTKATELFGILGSAFELKAAGPSIENEITQVYIGSRRTAVLGGSVSI